MPPLLQATDLKGMSLFNSEKIYQIYLSGVNGNMTGSKLALHLLSDLNTMEILLNFKYKYITVQTNWSFYSINLFIPTLSIKHMNKYSKKEKKILVLIDSGFLRSELVSNFSWLIEMIPSYGKSLENYHY